MKTVRGVRLAEVRALPSGAQSLMPLQALVVDTDPERAIAIARTLSSSGFETTEAVTFERALAAANTRSFDVLVTAVRLGAYNGLHLVLRTSPSRVAAIVTTPAQDPVLDAEAKSFGAGCVIAPWEDPTDMLACIARSRSVVPL
jgi:PleD family two-component response regulator